MAKAEQAGGVRSRSFQHGTALLCVAALTFGMWLASPATASEAEERLVFTRGCDAGPENLPVWFVDPTGGADPTPSRVISSIEPSVSPDGTALALSHWEGLWVGDPAGEGRHVVDAAQVGPFPEFPTWSPTGDSIAFFGVRDGDGHLMVVDLGNGEVRSLLAVDMAAVPRGLDWSPDGERLLWAWEDEIGTVEVADGSVTVLGPGSEARYGPGGDRVAFSIGGYLATMASDGSDRLITGQRGTSPIWSPDGSQLAFQARAADGGQPAAYLGVYTLADGGVSVVYEGDEVCDDVLYLSDWAAVDWPVFEDVLFDHVFYQDVEWLAGRGITRGCDPPTNDRYCPESDVTRGQMAAFLTRALDLTERDVDRFTDDDGSIFESDIDALAAAGITRGCDPPGNTRFCPEEPVTRGEMAAFLVRALGLSGGAGENRFTDDDGSVFESDIEALAAAGITRGCDPPGNTRFCPEEPVTRGEMAAFLHRAIDR